jgi:hypothetical protein
MVRPLPLGAGNDVVKGCDGVFGSRRLNELAGGPVTSGCERERSFAATLEPPDALNWELDAPVRNEPRLEASVEK